MSSRTFTYNYSHRIASSLNEPRYSSVWRVRDRFDRIESTGRFLQEAKHGRTSTRELERVDNRSSSVFRRGEGRGSRCRCIASLSTFGSRICDVSPRGDRVLRVGGENVERLGECSRIRRVRNEQFQVAVHADSRLARPAKCELVVLPSKANYRRILVAPLVAFGSKEREKERDRRRCLEDLVAIEKSRSRDHGNAPN